MPTDYPKHLERYQVTATFAATMERVCPGRERRRGGGWAALRDNGRDFIRTKGPSSVRPERETKLN